MASEAQEHFSITGKTVWVAGHNGMVGSALVRRLGQEPCRIATVERSVLDLEDQNATRAYVKDLRPEAIILAAAKVGGILANDTRPAEFIYRNLMIQSNVIDAAHRAGVERLLFLGSSCIYPKHAHQPIKEHSLLTGPLEPTNHAYAVAKIAGVAMVQSYRRQYGLDYIAAMPTNLYGPNDNFDLYTSHVLPALIRKAHEAKIARASRLEIWGTGSPLREFLHVDDCADALVLLLRRYSSPELVNVGSEAEISILDLAQMVCEVVGFSGKVVCDPSKPDGAPRKVMSGEKLRALSWRPRIDLRQGIASTYEWFSQHLPE